IEARLHILKELVKQVDGRLNELLLRRVLDLYGIRRDKDWIATQLRKLEALGAVELVSAGEMLVAKITRAGRDHVEERAVIEG
ncbi:VpaChn25_0724 family phage protein, partial [Vibrio parahaemolyticus]